MAEYNININEIPSKASMLNAGDRLLLSGTVYTSRDAAHKRMYEALEKGTAPCVTPEQAYVVSQILEGIYISAKTGEPYYFNK